MNFRNMDYNAARPMNNLARQPSLYSLTFNEFQNSLGGVGKDFGSMNMDELLKNIWTAEETEGMVTPFASAERGLGIGNLQQQGSLTLPRTLSQKTVDEVWKDLFKDNGGKDVNSNLGSCLQQKQQTLGEMTLEEFLVRAGVVREETQIAGRPTTSGGIYGELSPSSNNSEGLSIGYPQPGQTNGVIGDIVMGNNNNTSNIYQFSNHSNQSPPKPVIDVNNIRSQQQLFPPNQAMVVFGSSMCGDELGNSGMSEPVMSKGFRQGGHGMQSGAGKALVGLGPGSIMTGTGSPTNQPSLGGAQKRNLDTSSLSPLPYVLNGGLRGRKCSGAVEKVVERRQKRMIKNRESAARSRARKQAYTIELEAELAKLKEEKEEIQKKQAEILEKHKNQILKALNLQHRSKKRCLRRTQTGPW